MLKYKKPFLWAAWWGTTWTFIFNRSNEIIVWCQIWIILRSCEDRYMLKKIHHLLTGVSMYKLRIELQKTFLKLPGTIAVNSINNAVKIISFSRWMNSGSPLSIREQLHREFSKNLAFCWAETNPPQHPVNVISNLQVVVQATISGHWAFILLVTLLCNSNMKFS